MELIDRILGRRTGSVFGDYHAVRTIYEGEKSRVYEGSMAGSDETVAIKLFTPAYERTVTLMTKRHRIPWEGEVGMALNPPDGVAGDEYPIVRTILHGREFGRRSGCRYIVLEYVHGIGLRTLIQNRHIILTDMRRQITSQLCRALALIHAKGMIFRDVNAENVIVRLDGRVKLIDLGFVAPSGIVFEERAGTPSYMSPEQIKGGELRPATDIYSLGALFHEMVFGRLPFTTGTAADTPIRALQRRNEIMKMHLEAELPQPSEEDARLAGGFLPIIRRCLAKEPDARFSDAAELLEEIEKL
ncbi:MAG TPA: serine/threonine-protein kinase [Candidatus Brocadiia bacterium]|nr:serine/threonine-protein kinase [Candidatus Brocadiia bacterium]